MKAAHMVHTDNQEPNEATMLAAVAATQRHIRNLNDEFRCFPEKTLGLTGKIVLTAGISTMGWGDRNAILQAVKGFCNFNDGNDPHGEHDFGFLEFKGKAIYWKIDYYTPDLKHGSPDPADPAVTCRVLTIMLASEY